MYVFILSSSIHPSKLNCIIYFNLFYFYFIFYLSFNLSLYPYMLESRTRNPKVASSSLGPAGIVGGGVNVQHSLHPQ